MIVVLGFMLLAIAAWRLKVIYERDREPGGENFLVERDAVRARVARGKYRAVHSVTASFDIPADLRFELYREGVFDGVAKRLGLARELQTGDVPFDGRIYIQSEDAAFHDALVSRPKLRNALFALMRDPSTRRVGSANRRLWLSSGRYDSKKELSDEQLRWQIATDFLPDVHAVREALAHVVSIEPASDPTWIVRRWFSMAVLACVIAGAVGWIGYFLLFEHQLVRAAIPRVALWITFAIGLALLAGLFSRLSSTAFTHRVLLDILIAALPGSWLAASGGAMCYNQWFDTVPARRVSVPVAQAYAKSGKSTSYHLVIGWWPVSNANQDVQVRREEFAMTGTGGCIDVMWHAGRLGDAWIEGFLPSDRAQCEPGVES